jgi:hypothetical protein
MKTKTNSERKVGLTTPILICGLFVGHQAMAQLFLPDTTFLQGINVSETAAFGETGTLNSITHNGNAVDYNITFGPNEDLYPGEEGVDVDATFFGPALNLSGFTGTEVNTEVLSGSLTIVMYVQGGTPPYSWVQADGPSGQSLANGVIPLTDEFLTSNQPLDPSDLIRYGFGFFGPVGTTATIEILPVGVPDQSLTLALLAGVAGGLEFLRRRKV